MPSDQPQPAPATSNVSNDEIQQVMRDYRTQRRVCDTENGVLRNILKRAKNIGINTKALTATAKAARLDPDEVITELRDTLHYMSLTRMQVTPDSLFASWTPTVTEKSRMADDVWTAEDAGYKAGRHGADRKECPYDRGSELEVAWLRWWTKGQESIAKELGENARQASTARERPKRQQANIPGTEAPEPEPEPAPAPRKRRANGSSPAARRRNVAGDERTAAVN